MCKIKSIALLIAFLLYGLGISAARTIHVIVVGDTNDRSIGVSVQSDLVLFDVFVKELASVANPAGYSFRSYVLTGSQCSPASVKRTISNLSVEGDIVLFYYSGHGGRSHKDDASSKFPRMCLGSSYADQWIKVSDALAMIRAKNPKFVLMITDCCNSYYDRKSNNEAAPLFRANADSEAIRRLFLESSGYASITGASPGEYGWCNQNGAYMTIAFLQQIWNARGKSVTWQRLLQSVSDETYSVTNNLYRNKRISKSQRPVFEASVSYAGNGGYVGWGTGSGNINNNINNDPPPNNGGYTNNNNGGYTNNNNNGGNTNNITIPVPPVRNRFGIGNIISFLVSLLFGWLLIKKIPELLNLDGIISLIIKVIGVIIVIRALLTLF